MCIKRLPERPWPWNRRAGSATPSPRKPKRRKSQFYDPPKNRKQAREARKRRAAKQVARLQAASEQRSARVDEVEAALDVASTQRQSRLFSALPTELRTAIFRLVITDEPCPNSGPPHVEPPPGATYRVKCGPHFFCGDDPNTHYLVAGPWCFCPGCVDFLKNTQFGSKPGRISVTLTESTKALFAYRRFYSLELLRTCKRAYVDGLALVYGNNKTWSFTDNYDIGWRQVLRPARYFPYGRSAAPLSLPIRTMTLFLNCIGAVGMNFLENISITMHKNLHCHRYTMPNFVEEAFALLKACTRLKRIELQLCSHDKWAYYRERGQIVTKVGTCLITMSTPGHLEDMVDIARRFWVQNERQNRGWAIPVAREQDEKVSNRYSMQFGSIEVAIDLNKWDSVVRELLRHPAVLYEEGLLRGRRFYKEGLQADTS